MNTKKDEFYTATVSAEDCAKLIDGATAVDVPLFDSQGKEVQSVRLGMSRQGKGQYTIFPVTDADISGQKD